MIQVARRSTIKRASRLPSRCLSAWRLHMGAPWPCYGSCISCVTPSQSCQRCWYELPVMVSCDDFRTLIVTLTMEVLTRAVDNTQPARAIGLSGAVAQKAVALGFIDAIAKWRLQLDPMLHLKTSTFIHIIQNILLKFVEIIWNSPLSKLRAWLMIWSL